MKPTINLWQYATDAATGIFFLLVISIIVIVYSVFIIFPFAFAGFIGRLFRILYYAKIQRPIA